MFDLYLQKSTTNRNNIKTHFLLVTYNTYPQNNFGFRFYRNNYFESISYMQLNIGNISVAMLAKDTEDGDYTVN